MAVWEKTRDVFLRHSVSIAGRVLDGYTQEPIAGARVAIIASEAFPFPDKFALRRDVLKANDPQWEQRVERLDQTLSRADGSYFFMDLPEGTYQLQAISPYPGTCYKSTSERISAIIVGAAGKVTLDKVPLEADLELWPTRITGTVLRKDTGAPVAGARVRIVGTRHEALTDKDGKYRLIAVEAGKWTLKASARLYIPGMDKVAERLEDLEVQRATDEQVISQLEPGDEKPVTFSLTLD